MKIKIPIKDHSLICGVFSFIVFSGYIISVYDWPGASLAGHNSDSYIVFNALTDMKFYMENASGLLDGTWPVKPFFRAPLYSYFLAGLLLICDSVLWIVIVQLFFASFTVWLTSKLGTMLFNKATGVIAAMLLTFYGGYVYFIAIPHTAVLEVFLATLSLYLIYLLREKFIWRNALFFGIISTLLCLIRPNYLVICLPVAAVICFEFYLKHKDKDSMKRSLIYFSISVAVFILMFAPFVVWNNMHSDKPVFLTTNGMVTYRFGNSYDSLVYNYQEPKRELMPVYSWSFWRHQFKKAIACWKSVEYPQNVNYYLFMLYSKFLRWLPVNFGFIGALFFAGIIYFYKDIIKLWPLYFYVFVYLLTIIAFFIIGRFRLPAVPAMLIPGAAFIAYIIKITSQRMINKINTDEKVRIVCASVVFIGVFIFSEPWKTVYTGNSWRMLSRQYFLNLNLKEYLYCQSKLFQFDIDHYYVKLNLLTASAFSGNIGQANKLIEELKVSRSNDPIVVQTERELKLLNAIMSGKQQRSAWLYYLKHSKYKGYIGNFYVQLMNVIDARKKFGLDVPEPYNRMSDEYKKFK